jgi:hypothetical protein
VRLKNGQTRSGEQVPHVSVRKRLPNNDAAPSHSHLELHSRFPVLVVLFRSIDGALALVALFD